MTQIILPEMSQAELLKARMEASEKFLQVIRTCINSGHNPVQCVHFALANREWNKASGAHENT